MKKFFGKIKESIAQAFDKIKSAIKNLFAPKGHLYYVGNGESLPMPYTEEEENERIVKLSEGDEKIKNELIEHNLRLVIYIARRNDRAYQSGQHL